MMTRFYTPAHVAARRLSPTIIRAEKTFQTDHPLSKQFKISLLKSPGVSIKYGVQSQLLNAKQLRSIQYACIPVNPTVKFQQQSGEMTVQTSASRF